MSHAQMLQQPWILPNEDGECSPIISPNHHRRPTMFSDACSLSTFFDIDQSHPSMPTIRPSTELAPADGDCSVPASTKRRIDRPSFFDLPAELRIQIYEYICTDYYERYAPASSVTLPEGPRARLMHDPVTRRPAAKEQCIPADWDLALPILPWARYLARLRDIQLIDHQFRAEFLAV